LFIRGKKTCRGIFIVNYIIVCLLEEKKACRGSEYV